MSLLFLFMAFKCINQNVTSIEMVSFTFLFKLPRYLTKSMNLNNFARSKGLGSTSGRIIVFTGEGPLLLKCPVNC